MWEALVKLWADLGSVGHIAVYTAVMSLASVLVVKIPGKLGEVLKQLVDIFSANLSHKQPPAT